MGPQSCPFCPFSDSNPYVLAQHVETVHPEDGEPSFVSRQFLEEDLPTRCEEATTIQEAPSQDYIECECGEAIAVSDFEEHAQLHSAEAADTAADMAEIVGRLELSTQDHSTGLDLLSGPVGSTDPLPMAIESPDNHHSKRSSKLKQSSRGVDHGSQPSVKDRVALLLGPNAFRKRSDVAKHRNAKRLGEAELGPYAHEDRMPGWLQRQLERGAKVNVVNRINQQGQLVRVEVVANETRGVLPVLAQLCEQDNMLARVYLCHPGVQHVFKMMKEGGFCGYRNIQMMVSYIQAAQARGHRFFPDRLPSVLDLQELIESAWDRGINTAGRVETGGIRGTRKYIGTPEAQTLFTSLNLGCEATALSDKENLPGHKQVYEHVEQYFINGAIHRGPKAETVCKTYAAPIYFQHQGHSLTIVGLEIRKSGSRNLLVFDPSFKPSPGIQRLIGTQFRTVAPEKLLKAYRRGDSYLGKHSSFELLKLSDRLPLGAGWDEH